MRTGYLLKTALLALAVAYCSRAKVDFNGQVTPAKTCGGSMERKGDPENPMQHLSFFGFDLDGDGSIDELVMVPNMNVSDHTALEGISFDSIFYFADSELDQTRRYILGEKPRPMNGMAVSLSKAIEMMCIQYQATPKGNIPGSI